MATIERGTQVTVIAYKGVRLRKRVWEDTGKGVMVCSEEEYQRALVNEDQPLCSGFPKADVIEGDMA